MTSRSKQTLYDYFCSGGSAEHSISTWEQELEDLIDSIGPVGLSVAASDASNSSKGRADYLCDGTADEVQIQAAIDALPTIGGRVVLSEGTFTLAAAVQVSTDTMVVGQGYSTNIDHVAALQFAFTDDGAASPDDVVVSDIRFVAAGSRSAEPIGIDLGVTDGASNVIIKNCWFDNYVYASGTPSGVRGKYDGLKVINCHFNSASGTGNSYLVYLSDGGENILIDGCTFLTSYAGNCIYAYGQTRGRIIGNRIEGTTLTPLIEGIDLEECAEFTIVANSFYNLSVDGILIGGNVSGSSEVIVSGNTFDACGKTNAGRRAAVTVGLGESQACTNILITGNIVTDGRTLANVGEYGENIANEVSIVNNYVESCTYPSALYGNNYNILLSGNKFVSSAEVLYIETGTLVARDNIGYLTENSGTATIDSGQVDEVVTHGLGAQPTVINVTFREAGDNDYGRWHVLNIGVTYFTVRVSSDPGSSHLDFAWEAKVR